MTPFADQAALFANFVQRSLAALDTPVIHEGRIGVLLTRWTCPSVAWYCIALAMLMRNQGYETLLVYDDLTADIIPGDAEQTPVLEAFLRVFDRLPVVRLSEMPELPPTEEDREAMADKARLNAFYLSRTTLPIPEVQERRAALLRDFTVVMPRIKGFFASVELAGCIIPGGLLGHTGLFIQAGKGRTRTSTFDTGPNEFLMGLNDVAGYLRDIPTIVTAVDDYGGHAFERAKATEELAKRLGRKDARQFQLLAFDEARSDRTFDVFIPLNIECDTASQLPRHGFDGLWDWLGQTVDHALTQGLTVAVREHPSIYNSSALLGEAIALTFGQRPGFTFYRRTEKVNSYRLALDARLVLPYSSTMGVESAMLGRRVLVESPVYYGELSFVTKAAGVDDYFARLRDVGAGVAKPSRHARQQAEYCYFYTQYCNYLKTDFTPIPENFEAWVRTSLDDLVAQEKIRLIAEAYGQGLPLARLNARRRFGLDLSQGS